MFGCVANKRAAVLKSSFMNIAAAINKGYVLKTESKMDYTTQP